MDLIDAVRSRRSVSRVTEPAPSDQEVCAVVGDAATSPDHGLLRPWRLVLVRGAARETLGAAFAADLPAEDSDGRARAAAKPLRAPLLISIVFSAKDSPKVPRWEQMAATVCMVHTTALLLHGQGWGVMWRTGAPAVSAPVRELLGVRDGEQLLGWLYVGTAQPGNQPARPGPALRGQITALGVHGAIEPVGGSLAD